MPQPPLITGEPSAVEAPGKVGEFGTVRADRGTDRLLALSVGLDIAESVDMRDDMTSGDAG